MQRVPLADHQQDRVAASLPFVESLARRMASTMPHSIDLGDLVQDGSHRTDRRRQPVRRGPRHQIRDVCRTARPGRDDRRAAPRCLAAWRPPRPPRARSRPRAAAPRARRRAVAGRPGQARRRRCPAPRAHDRPHHHHRIHVADGESRDHRQLHAAGRARAERAAVAASRCSNRRRCATASSSALETLPERERRIITLYYFEEATMKQIGAAIGVNESRVSQLHARAIMRLKQALVSEATARPAAPACRRPPRRPNGQAVNTRGAGAARAASRRDQTAGCCRRAGACVRWPSSVSRATRTRSRSRNGFAIQRHPLSSRNRSASDPATSPVTNTRRFAMFGMVFETSAKNAMPSTFGIFRSQMITS